jgi:hypothetical protein
MRFAQFRPAMLIATCLCLTAAWSMTVRAEETSVHGRVMGQTAEGEHLGPVPGAKVEFLAPDGSPFASAVADDAGYYRVAGLATPAHDYRITADGYRDEDARRGVEVSIDGAHVLDFVLTQGGPGDKPEGKPDDQPKKKPRKRQNDDPGKKPETKPRNPGDNPGDRPDDAPADPDGGSLVVRTWKEKEGKRSPFADVEINLRRVEGGPVHVQATSAQGRRALSIPAGHWRVSASAPGVAAAAHPEPIQIAAGSRKEVDLTLAVPTPTPRAPPPPPPTNDGGKACFYGDVAAAKRVVFVVDKSISMRVDKFDEAAAELMRSMNYLTEGQQFYVIFFSDETHPMFGSEAPSDLLPATAANRDRLQKYLGELPFRFGTRAHSSMERALALKPDVIYLLGDGAFTDDTANYLLGLRENQVPICTVAFKSKARGAATMKRIADMHHGRFMYVP